MGYRHSRKEEAAKGKWREPRFRRQRRRYRKTKTTASLRRYGECFLMICPHHRDLVPLFYCWFACWMTGIKGFIHQNFFYVFYKCLPVLIILLIWGLSVNGI